MAVCHAVISQNTVFVPGIACDLVKNLIVRDPSAGIAGFEVTARALFRAFAMFLRSTHCARYATRLEKTSILTSGRHSFDLKSSLRYFKT